jgi:tripartite-type tricarboxylate transporter receptor subunit TctC
VAPLVKSGKLRALAVTTTKPSALVPDVPTVAATGLPGYESVATQGLWVPIKTPTAIINRLNKEIVLVLNQPETKEKLLAQGVETIGSTPEEFSAFIKSNMTEMSKIIKDAGIREE